MALKPKSKSNETDAVLKAVEDAISIDIDEGDLGKALEREAQKLDGEKPVVNKADAKKPATNVAAPKKTSTSGTNTQTKAPPTKASSTQSAKSTTASKAAVKKSEPKDIDLDDSDIDLGELEKKLASVANDIRADDIRADEALLAKGRSGNKNELKKPAAANPFATTAKQNTGNSTPPTAAKSTAAPAARQVFAKRDPAQANTCAAKSSQTSAQAEPTKSPN